MGDSLLIDLRLPTPSDVERFKECLTSDEWHNKQDAEEWMAKPGEFWVFFDGHENRVWVRIEKVLKISIQHDQATRRRELLPIIYKGFAWVLNQARKSGFTGVLFESKEPRLIAFCKKLFGFELMKDFFHVRSI